MLLGDLVLALALAEAHQLEPLFLDELLDASYERLAHRRHRRRGSKALAAVLAQVPHHAPDVLQPGHVGVEVHAIDGLVLQRHVVA
jgi:hypothetical protein